MKCYKTRIAATITFYFFCLSLNIKAQHYTYTANYYDTSALLNGSEVGEDIIAYRPLLVRGYSGYFFTAGEYAKDQPLQGLRMANFDKNGTLLQSVRFDNSGYKEYVKKIVATYKSLYVICNAVGTNADSVLLVLRYNFNLQLKAQKFFKKPVYFLPATAAGAVTSGTNKIDEIYIACYQKENAKSGLAIIHLDSNLSIKHAFEYNYTGAPDNYIEKPADMDIALSNHNAETIYVAGGILGTDNITRNLLIKLNGNLTTAWIKTSPSEHVMYNSVKQTGAPNYVVYTAGTAQTNNGTNWKIEKIDTLTGNTLAHISFSHQQYNTIPVKITAVTNKLVVTGYEQSTALNTFNAVIGEFDTSLNTVNGYPVYYKIQLPAGSVLNDAVQDNNATWIAGQKITGTNKNMFLYKIDNTNGSAVYRDSVINSNAAINKIAVLDGGTTYPDSNHIAVTGFKNNSANKFQPQNLSYVTRIYTPQFTPVFSEAKYLKPYVTGMVLSQNNPNPFSNTTTINYFIPQQFSSAKIIVTDKNGNTLKAINISGGGKGSVKIDASTLAGGAYEYSLYVNNKLIDTKQMISAK
ncbi:MAG TPA: hypothetical protein VHB70_14825 [Parafilimonas sp.]|nr:hypothetical protein [Parafilimonas sp.]